MKKHDLVLLVLTIIVVITTIAVILTNGSPFDQKKRALDQQKTSAMDGYKAKIENYYSLQRRLPQSLEEAQSALSSIQPSLDPSIEYKITSETQYQLCTTFQAAYLEQTTMYTPSTESGYIKNTHNAGYDCYSYIIPNYILNNAHSVPAKESPTF